MSRNIESSTEPESGTNSAETPSNSLEIMPRLSFQRRTLESARQLRVNFNNVLREIQESARTNATNLTDLIGRPLLETPQNAAAGPSNSTVISLDEAVPSTNNIDNENRPDLNNAIPEAEPSENAENSEASDNERAQAAQEVQRLFNIMLKYIPFLLILLAKGLYDYHVNIFIIIILFTAFIHANSIVKSEVIKRNRRSLKTLSLELIYISASFLFLVFVFEDKLHSAQDIANIVLLRMFRQHQSIWNLLWIIIITDFVLKLITIELKIILALLPDKIVSFQKRGKFYLFIEAVSQTYRSITTIHPWLYYLLESYEGPEKIVGVFLSAFFIISKGPDLISKLHLLRTACIKLLQNMSIGYRPTKEQMQIAGELCPICHDQYDTPVQLQCNHIFCENCVSTWFDREQTCPLCRAKIVDDPSWRDGSTTYYIQMF